MKKETILRKQKSGWAAKLLAGTLAVLVAWGGFPGKAAASEAGSGGEESLPILRDVVGEELCPIFGAGITEGEMSDEKLWNLVTTHFSAVTFGNELKPDALFGYSNGRCPGTREEELDGETMVVPVMDFSRAERMLDKVKAWNDEHPEKKIMVRGHVLVWHSQTPEWFFHEDYDKNKPYVDKETMDKRQKWYIKTVLEHFAGEGSPYEGMFYGWDVVNEAVSDGTGTYRSDAENASEDLSQDTHGSNSSWWHVYQSNEYIINAFRYANQYAPASVELYYNDYNECSGQKMMGIKELLQAVKAQEGAPGEGTRIDAMGMQGHYNLSDPSFDKFTMAIETYVEVVGKVQITEMDLQSSDDYDGTDATREEEYAKQASRYRLLYTMLKNAVKNSGAQVGGITFWGVVDKYSWLQGRSTVGGGSDRVKPQCPLLFDDDYQAKPAFWVFADASRLTSDGRLKEPEGAGTEGTGAENAGTEGAGTDGTGTENAGTSAGTEGAGAENAGTEGTGTDGVGTDGAEAENSGTDGTGNAGTPEGSENGTAGENSDGAVGQNGQPAGENAGSALESAAQNADDAQSGGSLGIVLAVIVAMLVLAAAGYFFLRRGAGKKDGGDKS